MSGAIAIRGGRVVDPANGVDRLADLHIVDGRIAALGAPPPGANGALELDASGCLVIPGLVDLSVRTCEPGAEHKATIASELAAAARAGVTTVCLPPDTRPILDTPAVVELIHARTLASGQARVVCLGALTRKLEGTVLAEMAALLAIGCVGVSNARAPVQSTAVQRRAFEYAANFGLTVFIQPEDPWLAAEGAAHEGAVATRLGIPGIPETAETIALSRDLLLIEQTGVRAHFGRLSTAQGVRLVTAARRRGLRVTSDVSLQHLELTEHDLEGYNANCHLRPPLRSRADREALRRGVARGLIDAICSDHEPQDRDAKAAPFAASEPGASALETLLPLSLGLVEAGVLPLAMAIAALSSRPAGILGLPVGHLGVGATADVCVFDPAMAWVVSAETLLSHGKNSPFLGRAVQGGVRWTLLEGRVVHRT
jgi:dihydroorotase